jgi:hypothetical protein
MPHRIPTLDEIMEQSTSPWSWFSDISDPLVPGSSSFLDIQTDLGGDLFWLTTHWAPDVLTSEEMTAVRHSIDQLLNNARELCISTVDLFSVMYRNLEMPEDAFDAYCRQIYDKTQDLRREWSMFAVQVKMNNAVVLPDEANIEAPMISRRSVRERILYMAYGTYCHANIHYITVIGKCWQLLAWLLLPGTELAWVGADDLEQAEGEALTIMESLPVGLDHYHEHDDQEGFEKAFEGLVADPFEIAFLNAIEEAYGKVTHSTNEGENPSAVAGTVSSQESTSNDEESSNSNDGEVDVVQASSNPFSDEGGWTFR